MREEHAGVLWFHRKRREKIHVGFNDLSLPALVRLHVLKKHCCMNDLHTSSTSTDPPRRRDKEDGTLVLCRRLTLGDDVEQCPLSSRKKRCRAASAAAPHANPAERRRRPNTTLLMSVQL